MTYINHWSSCHIEMFPDDLWYIVYPDATKALQQGYKNKGSATRTLNYYLK